MDKLLPMQSCGSSGLRGIPCTVMRGGTSKGPYFLARDLPTTPDARDRVVLAAMGSPDIRQVDGIGGGDSLTSKAVIVGPSVRPGIDVDYLFAQVSVDKFAVDTAPNCGNMLAGVGPFAIERGLLRAGDPTTTVRIFNINTGKVVEAVVQTPGGQVTYEGEFRIDGVPGTGAPVLLNFLDAGGAKTGRLLPTGRPVDVVDGIEVSCVDFSSPIVFVAAASLGKTGHESKKDLDADRELLTRLEKIRRGAALLMGLGDVSRKVLPKIALVAPPLSGGTIASRYFVPWTCHAAYAVTGALCLAAVSSLPGTVAAAAAFRNPLDRERIVIEHPAGKLETCIETSQHANSESPVFARAGIVRTARPLFSGVVHIADDTWPKAA